MPTKIKLGLPEIEMETKLMFDAAARQFLQKPLIARLATIGADGYPHNIPLWFLLEGDEILLFSDRSTRKTQNLQANPKAAICIGGDPHDGAGYMIKADVSIEEDEAHAFTKRITYHYETQADADRLLKEWENDDIVIVRLKPISVIKVY